MYPFPNQSAHNGYQQFFGVPATEPVTSTIASSASTRADQTGAVSVHSVVNAQPPAPTSTCEPRPEPSSVKSSAAAEATGNKGRVDTSSFTIEQRVVAAAWVHERHHTHTSIGQIKQQFSERFGRAAPAKNTLLVWERKLFAAGAVHDAPRSGRPATRKLLAGEVRASLRAAPALSLRARAAALRVPRSTLRRLLPHTARSKPVTKKPRRARRGSPPPAPRPPQP